MYYFLNARVTSVFSEIFREQETSKENDQIRSAKSHTLAGYPSSCPTVR